MNEDIFLLSFLQKQNSIRIKFEYIFVILTLLLRVLKFLLCKTLINIERSSINIYLDEEIFFYSSSYHQTQESSKSNYILKEWNSELLKNVIYVVCVKPVYVELVKLNLIQDYQEVDTVQKISLQTSVQLFATIEMLQHIK